MEFDLPGMGAFVRDLKGEIEAGLHDRVEFGVKRFAKALKKAGAKRTHTELIDAVSQSLGFASWADVLGSVSHIERKTFDKLVTQLRPVLNCPLPKYDRPAHDVVSHLRSMAVMLATTTGLSERTILDKVFAYVHEAKSFDELVSRDPCLLTPMFDVVDADDDDRGTVILFNQVFAAAARVFADEMRVMEGSPNKQRDRAWAIIEQNPDFIPAWDFLCRHFLANSEDDEETRDAFVQAAESMLDVLYLGDALDEATEDEFAGTGALVARQLALIGESELSYNLSYALFVAAEEKGVAFAYFMGACACAPHMVGEFFADELDAVFAGSIRDMEPDGLMILGMAMAAGDDLLNETGLALLARAHILLDGALAPALRGDDETATARMTDREMDEVAFTLSMVHIMRANNRALVEMVCEYLSRPAVESAVANAVSIKESWFSCDEESVAFAEYERLYQSMVFSTSLRLAAEFNAMNSIPPRSDLH